MTKLRLVSIFALLFAFSGLANAETVRVSGISAGSDDGRPSRGMTQSRVQSKFGSPVTTRAAVGEPPITRWEYPGFIVYFEHDKVIHAVVKR